MFLFLFRRGAYKGEEKRKNQSECGKRSFRWQKLLARGLSARVLSRNNRTVANPVPLMHNVFILGVGVGDKAVSLFTNHWIDWMKLHRCDCLSRKLSIRMGLRTPLCHAAVELLHQVPLPPSSMCAFVFRTVSLGSYKNYSRYYSYFLTKRFSNFFF